ncbi:MAG: hypothetical protein SGPRY_008157, partial [Prymnesium sp.]
MHKSFEIPGSQVVTGAARIQGGAGAVFDLSHLNPGSHVNDGGSVILSCFSPWPSWSKPTRDVAGRGAIGEAILRMLALYTPMPVRGDPFKFDLIPDNPVERKWELMATSAQ